MDEKIKNRIKRIVAVISLLTIIAIFSFITYFFIVEFKKLENMESFREYISSFGVWGMLVGLGLQILQVFVAFIPGEVVEVGLGFTYGAIGGTLICYAGIFVATTIVFVAVKKLGIKFVELFVSAEKINSVKFVQKYINNPGRLRKLAFLLFFIPGTPKDLFTYLFALTPMKYPEFIAISLIARLPSVVSSTIGGTLIASGRYVAAIVLFVVTGLLSFCGWLCYDRYKA